jgi:hypothetical protein
MSLHVSVFVSASAFGPVFLQDFAAAVVGFAARYSPGAALAIAEAMSWLGEARLSSDYEVSAQYFWNPVSPPTLFDSFSNLNAKIYYSVLRRGTFVYFQVANHQHSHHWTQIEAR